MSIRRLRITDLRNIAAAELDLARVNVLSGPNGSGKTSILEAVYLLGSGRSFRAPRLDPVIRREASGCVVHAALEEAPGRPGLSLGVGRDRDGGFEGRIQGREVHNTAELARCLPVQLINSMTFALLEGGPKARRQFLDWGVFHVEQGFHAAWLDVQRAIRQRNALLRHGRIQRAQMDAWDLQLAEGARQLDLMRQRYFEAFYPEFRSTLAELIDLEALELSYYRGWDRDRDLSGLLRDHVERDRQRGFTTSGPHRADIRVRLHGARADEVLSRGQQKLVICALKLAQGRVFARSRGQECIFLIDDLPSELDWHHRTELCRVLGSMPCQVLVSCVDAAELRGMWDALPADAVRVFHVEHGQARTD